jgi:hypothetical protein
MTGYFIIFEIIIIQVRQYLVNYEIYIIILLIGSPFAGVLYTNHYIVESLLLILFLVVAGSPSRIYLEGSREYPLNSATSREFLLIGVVEEKEDFAWANLSRIY